MLRAPVTWIISVTLDLKALRELFKEKYTYMYLIWLAPIYLSTHLLMAHACTPKLTQEPTSCSEAPPHLQL